MAGPVQVTLRRRELLGAALAAGVAAPVLGQTPPPVAAKGVPPGLPQPSETIDLWPGGAPGKSARALIETVDERSTDSLVTDRAVYGISRPRRQTGARQKL